MSVCVLLKFRQFCMLIVGDDPSLVRGESDQVLFAGEHLMIVTGGLFLVWQKPFEFEPAPGAPVALALNDGYHGLAPWTGGLNRREAVFGRVAVHAGTFGVRESEFLRRAEGPR